MMAQKINSTALRLNKRLNWSFLYCTHSYNDFSNISQNMLKLFYLNTNLLSKLNINQNKPKIQKSSKYYNISYKAINQQLPFFFTKVITTSKHSKYNFYLFLLGFFKLFRFIFKSFTLNKNQLKNNVAANWAIFNNKKIQLYPFLPLCPSHISNLIKIFISDSFLNNKNDFNKNLKKNVLNFLTFFLVKLKYNVIGIKIIISGKWKKTTTGRKEKTILKYGKIQAANYANKLFFKHLSNKTKYGIVSLKIWIACKKIRKIK